jgi:NAD(P)-dependent dehydrogenase (short-subunit alcohol dehydrogenase family)
MFRDLFSLDGRIALVTGGSRGIGKMIARGFLNQGAAKVYITARKANSCEATAKELSAEYDGECIALPIDISTVEGCDKLAAEIVEREPRLDILVNNAGAAWGAPAEDHPVEAWDKLMNLNVRGYFILSQHIAKRSMIPRKYGRIVNIASIAGLGGNPPEMTTLAYNTSKGAVISFTEALGCEWGKYNITVNAICPGFFPSKMTQATLNRLGEEKLAAHAPLKRLGDDEDLKGVTLLFASDAGKHITGQWLAVDGGVSVITGG